MSHTAIAVTSPGEIASSQVETPSPQANEVLLKVHKALIGSFDSHQVQEGFFAYFPQILGLALSGEVSKLGEGAGDALAVGDQIVAITFPPFPRSTQEYVIVQKTFIAKVPSNSTPEQAISVADNFVTAWWTVSHSLGLPLPKSADNPTVDDPRTSEPILIWAAGTSAAQITIQVLKLAGYKNIIATASKRSAAAATGFGANHVFDYNDPDVADKIKEAAGGSVKYALDPVGLVSSASGIAKAISPTGKVAILLPIKTGEGSITSGGHSLVFELPAEQNPYNKTVEIAYVSTFGFAADEHLRDNLFPNIFPALLKSGHIKPIPVRLLTKGSALDRVKEAAALIKENTLGGERAVAQITP